MSAFFYSVGVEVDGKDIKKVKIRFTVSQNMFILNLMACFRLTTFNENHSFCIFKSWIFLSLEIGRL